MGISAVCTPMSTTYRILIADRSYSSWTFENVDTDLAVAAENIPDGFHPATAKLFSKDVFELLEPTTEPFGFSSGFNATQTSRSGSVIAPTEPFGFSSGLNLKLLHSPMRTISTHAGILLLSENRTYGRCHTGKRLLYKCMPDDKYLPAFLIPYEVRLGFSKDVSNKFVVFRYDKWTQKHPEGILVETLGDVTGLEAFYEYQLYCKSLHDSITRLTQDARAALNRSPLTHHLAQIRSRHKYREAEEGYIFSIDPVNSLDFDDAVRIIRQTAPSSAEQLEPADEEWRVSIYIANVVVWLETLDLWNSLTNRVATIYLPDRRRPMLPTVLSDSLCSLQEGEDRFAFVCDMTVSIGKDGGGATRATATITSTAFRHAYVRVAKNYRYEEADLMACADYHRLLEITRRLDRQCNDSHDVVAFWMMETNRRCAQHFAKHETGIFRSVVYPQRGGENSLMAEEGNSLTDDCRRTIQMWNSNTSGQYVKYQRDLRTMQHDVLKCSVYVHMTSPIRRLVDLLNQMTFLSTFMGLSLSESAHQFLATWIEKLEFVNVSMRSIRKVQHECNLLYRCTTEPELLEQTFTGVVFDRMERSSGYFNYMVYMENLKLLCRVRTTKDVQNYDVVSCRLYLFENEEKRKIRMCLL